MRQSDDRDTEPDYLPRLTRHGPGDTLLDYSAFLFSAQVTAQQLGTWDLKLDRKELQRHLLHKDMLF